MIDDPQVHNLSKAEIRRLRRRTVAVDFTGQVEQTLSALLAGARLAKADGAMVSPDAVIRECEAALAALKIAEVTR